jgi:DNA-binding transcriptional LysR family regulator
MQKLEAALGSKLLTRTARGIDLTTAGETLLPVARRLDSLLGDLGQVFPKSTSRSPALIRIGSLETFAATHLAGLIASYHPIDPQPEFAITNGSSRSLVRMLQGDELDIAFVSHPASVESLRTELTLQEELVLFVPKHGGHKIDPQRGLANCQLPLIVQRQACSYSERFLSYSADHDLRVPRTIEAGSVEALLGLVEQGLGFAIAPRSLISGTARRIRIVSLTPFWGTIAGSISIRSAIKQDRTRLCYALSSIAAIAWLTELRPKNITHEDTKSPGEGLTASRKFFVFSCSVLTNYQSRLAVLPAFPALPVSRRFRRCRRSRR